MQNDQFVIHRTILSAGPETMYYEHELIDRRTNRVLKTVITRSAIAPEQMRKYMMALNEGVLSTT